MSIIRRIKRKNKQTGADEVVDLGALGSNIVQDATHRFVTNEEKTAWNGKVDASGGDISSTKISTITDSSEPFPVPEEDDPTDTWVGKIKKWQQDCLAKFGNYLLTSMISNQHQNNTGTVPSSALAYLMQQAIVANQNSINGLNTKLTNFHVIATTLFNGSAVYNQTYQTTGPINDYELYQVTVGWRQILCLKNWYDDTHNSLIGFAVYPTQDYSDLYRFEIVFDQSADAQSFYTNTLAVARLYPDGRYEYHYDTLVLNNIVGLKTAPRDW